MEENFFSKIQDPRTKYLKIQDLRTKNIVGVMDKKLGMYRVLIWPDIWPIILPDTATGYPAKNKFYFDEEKTKVLP